MTTISNGELDQLEGAYSGRPEGRGLFGYDNRNTDLVLVPGTNTYGVRLNEIEPNKPADIAALKTGEGAMSEKIKPQHVSRKAILYVRQSSPYQVMNNLESQKLQYAMEAHLRSLGWSEVEIIDEDLGRSAGGSVTRTGFERMVAQVCLGEVGAVCAREVSRFARNSREWQQLVEVCRIVDTLLVDQETVYSPRQCNDRLRDHASGQGGNPPGASG